MQEKETKREIELIKRTVPAANASYQINRFAASDQTPTNIVVAF